MVKTKLHIFRIIFLLLLTLGVTNEAWGQTYHILTKPFNVKNVDGTNKWTNDIRVEALKCFGTSDKVGLPAEYVSPLATNFKYYSNVSCSHTNTKLYDNDNQSKILATKYDIYEETDLTTNGATEIVDPANTDASDYTDIWVTYDYNASNTILKLDGNTYYNISLNTGNSQKYLCLNRSRNNRPGAANAKALNGEYLSSEDFVKPTAGTGADAIGFNWSTDADRGPQGLFLGFKFTGEDPYNVTIMTSYAKIDSVFPEKLAKESYKYVKPYTGATIYSKFSSNANNKGSEAKMWFSVDANRHYKTLETDYNNGSPVTYDEWEGYYRSDQDPIFNAVAILPNSKGGYYLVASKLNMNGNDSYQPNGSGYYAHLTDNNLNPQMTFRAASNALVTQFYEIKNYIFKVKTPFGTVITATKGWSDAYSSDYLIDHAPDALKRKYVSFTKAYTSDDPETRSEISTFADADAANNGRVIWLEYTTSMPFETLPDGGCYNDARYYTIRINGKQEQKNLGYLSGSSFYTGLGSNTVLNEGENSAEAQFAFIGDPFELKIISRAASEGATESAGVSPAASHNRYVGCATDASDGTTLTVQTGSNDISTWQIEPGNIASPDYFVLRQFNTEGKYIGWDSEVANKPMTYSTKSTTIRVVKLEKKNYVYHIVRSDGSIAVKATASQDIGVPLTLNNIPEIIRSPFMGSSISYYWTKANATASTDAKTHGSYELESENDIYVRYSTPITSYIDGDNYNVRLNGMYIYYDSSSGTIKSSATIEDKDGDSDTKEYLWTLSGSDPYAMTVQNVGNDNKYVMIADGDDEGTEPDWADGTISWSDIAPTSKFIIKSTTYDKVFEVMAATGESEDAVTTYYNIGRNSDTDVTKMYSNLTYGHNYEQLRFQLTSKDAISVTYHLIDKESKDLLHVTTLQEPNTPALFPDDYMSPLVTEYHYYDISQFTDPNTGTTPVMGNASATYHLNNSPTPYGNVTSSGSHIFVTYDVSDKYDMQNKKTTYLLKFDTGTPFRAEDGVDGLEVTPVMPIYPYCNGDCCFFVYGQAQFDLQQEGAASTRTRWAWYLESANNDPYHVKICSRQQETYNLDDIRGYFATYQPDDYDKVITSLVWPTISGIQGTDYMILGSARLFRLETTNVIPLDSDHDGSPESTQRYTVKSFEQYWKTFDTVKKKILDEELHILTDDDKGNSKYEDPDGSPTVPAIYRESLTKPIASGGGYEYHSYKKWAYAKRFNGYNKEGKTSKGWEEIEHWFQTVEMGEGYFTLEEVDINPVMILLDQHGWEIMRKPLPTSPSDPTKAAKYDQIRPYTSPMVEKYYFWTKASKRTGFHQYYSLSQQVTVDGEAFVSQSLTDLPPYETSANIKDAKGNLLDQYVTYTVKDEYVQSYNPSTKEGAEFLIQQGSKFASYNGTDLLKNEVPSTGGMQQYIIENIDNLTTTGSKKNELWYVKPNARIDYEMGYVDGDEEHDIVTNHDWTDAEDYAGYTGVFSDGFDPYNIQISSVPNTTKYFVTNASGATLQEGAGSLIGTYDNDPAISIQEPYTDIPCTWYDSRALAITNATFMAVQDADDNMQLMPRFDHNRRMKDFSTLVPTTDPGIANTYTELYRPLVYNYHIIDNGGQESLRYKSGGDLVPQTPDHFKSPLAKDFKYYKESTCENEIDESFAGESMTNANNDVYVRYSYDAEADEQGILQGKWMTMSLNYLDAIYDSGIKQASGDKPSPLDDEGTAEQKATKRAWQWKLLKTPQTDPDPYAVQLFNRNNPGSNNELPATGKYFALLSHTSDGFALAEARTENTNYDTYNFLNGNGAMDDDTPAAIAQESGFLSTSCSFSGANSQLQLIDEVVHTYTYKIYTNSGAFAISETQDNETVVNNEYVPVLPENIKSPLLNLDQFRYYEQDLSVVTPDTASKALTNLYGLYDDIVYVHYTPYDPLVTEYKVPNERNATDSEQVERANTSNDASIEINDDLLYNIIWHQDNMMRGVEHAGAVYDDITGVADQEIGGTPSGQVWYFAGQDPYAIKFRTTINSGNRYIHKSGDASCNLIADVNNATTFMLLPRDDSYEYGMFQITGGTQKLTGYGSTLTTGDAVPTKFIIFALSTHKVTYHLVIANINSSENIPARDKNGNPTTITIEGTTQRNLTANAIADHAVGHVSLGDLLKVPEEMYRPNVDFFFYVGDIKDVNNDGTDGALNESLTNLYKGHLITAMGKDPDLVGKHVYINIVYSFQGGLPTNAGNGFVTSVSQNKWYTFEAQKSDGTPQLMQFTNAWGMEVKEGRGTHYTNDYLWTPIGDPYGFKMYHRYTCVNSGNDNTGEPNRVMTTAGFAENQEVWMDDASGTGANKISSQGTTDEEKEAAKEAAVTNSVYELLADKATESSPGTTPGYFKIHPVANSAGTQYYFKIVRAHEDPLNDSTPEHDYVRLSSDDDYTEFTFGLSEELLKPYYDRAGYVGGLTSAGKTAYEAATNLIEKQTVVYNPANIVKYSPGYYRLHSPEDIEGVTVRYASGYTHKIERDQNDDGNEDDAIPMHFYERKGVNTTFEILANGFTRSDATRGAIPISEPVYDPASIFYFYEGSEANPMSRIQTQGLYLKGVKGPVGIDTSTNPATLINPSDPNIEATNERAAAVMTATSGEAQPLYIMDIGGGILLIHDNVTALGRQYLKYLSFDQNDPDHIYDLKLTHNTHTDHAKWLMEPANAQGLTLAAHSGLNAGTYGATYYHTSFYAPFDVLISGDQGKAYTCVEAVSPWPETTTGDLHPKPIGAYNTGTYVGNNNFVPAGTPVLIAGTDNSGTVKLTIPTTTPSTPISTIFSGEYLEQKLDGTSIVYTFGLPFISELTMNNETGEITGTLPQQAETGVGFYKNANPNKELGLARAEWIRNNRYVIHNKIYYRAAVSPTREMTRGIEFVPVIFDYEDEQDEEQQFVNNGLPGDNCIYDLLGRKVATEQQVKDGTWHERLAPGIYIMNGKKFRW